jgi:hypothetical protein
MKALQTMGKLVRISLARCKSMLRFVQCLLARVTRDDTDAVRSESNSFQRLHVSAFN